MLGLQGLLLALLVGSRPFAWAPTLRRLWARHRAWRRFKVSALHLLARHDMLLLQHASMVQLRPHAYSICIRP